MKRALCDIFGGFRSLLTGLRITLQQFFKSEVTVHYPHEVLQIPKRYRGHIVLLRDPDTGKALCVACKSCEKACPSDCIVVDGVKREGEKKKSVTDFKLNFTTCSLCGSCVEVCPIEAIQFSREYNLASTRKEDFYQIDLAKDPEGKRP
jgi:NADH-quinone oxidoreductase subunit I